MTRLFINSAYCRISALVQRPQVFEHLLDALLANPVLLGSVVAHLWPDLLIGPANTADVRVLNSQWHIRGDFDLGYFVPSRLHQSASRARLVQSPVILYREMVIGIKRDSDNIINRKNWLSGCKSVPFLAEPSASAPGGCGRGIDNR